MKEKDIQKMVVQWLQMHSLTADNFFSIPNEGKRSHINGKNLELISFTLSQRELLQSFGDSFLFSKHFNNL